MSTLKYYKDGKWEIVTDPGALRIDEVQTLNEEQTNNLKQTLESVDIAGGVGVKGKSDFSVNFNNIDTNTSGGKAFRVLDVSGDVITLDSVQGIQEVIDAGFENSVDTDGLYASVRLFYNYSHVGKVTSVDSTNKTVTIDGISSLLKTEDTKIQGTSIETKANLWFPYHPELGTTYEYSSCTLTAGEDNIAHHQYTSAIGARNVADAYYSHVIGRDNFSGYADLTMGYGNKNYGTYSYVGGERNSLTPTSEGTHVEGAGNVVDGSHKHVEGTNNISEGNNNSHTEGNGNTNPAELTHVEGQLNVLAPQATGMHVEGKSNIAMGSYSTWSHIEGVGNTNKSYAAHIEGTGNTVSADRGHAEGMNNTVSGARGHAEGEQNAASGTNSHSQGYKNTASGSNSFASGENNVASGQDSTALGVNSIASHNYSAVIGNGLQTGAMYQLNAGKFNKGKSDTLFEVGNGLGANGRNNAFEVNVDGTVRFGANPKNAMDGATKEYVDNVATGGISFNYTGTYSSSNPIVLKDYITNNITGTSWNGKLKWGFSGSADMAGYISNAGSIKINDFNITYKGSIGSMRDSWIGSTSITLPTALDTTKTYEMFAKLTSYDFADEGVSFNVKLRPNMGSSYGVFYVEEAESSGLFEFPWYYKVSIVDSTHIDIKISASSTAATDTIQFTNCFLTPVCLSTYTG
jgi:hypothetical protein